MLKNKVIQENICWLYLNFDLVVFNKIIKSIYSIFGFNQFIKQIDKTNGCLVDTNELNTLNIKSFENIIKTHNTNQFDVNNYSIDIYKYCSEFDLNKIIVETSQYQSNYLTTQATQNVNPNIAALRGPGYRL